ncbi:MAG: recombinase family protein [Candidatus Tyrphobacter sp.]
MSVGYCRVSTQEQAEQGVSLDAQRSRLQAVAQSHGEALTEVFVDDGYSGASMDRPAMKRLVALIERREVAAVLVCKLDRLTRSLRDMLDLVDLCDRTETRLVSASESLDTGSAIGRMVLQVVSAFAEFERGMVSERTSAALDFKRSQRQVYGAVPFGYRRDGEMLVAVPAEQEALADMRRMHSEGATYRAIGEMLETRGVQPRGRRWYPSSVRAVLLSKMTREAEA